MEVFSEIKQGRLVPDKYERIKKNPQGPSQSLKKTTTCDTVPGDQVIK